MVCIGNHERNWPYTRYITVLYISNLKASLKCPTMSVSSKHPGYGLFITTVSQPVGYHVHCEPVILQLSLIVSDEYLAYMCTCIFFVAVQGITTTQILVENVECHMR